MENKTHFIAYLNLVKTGDWIEWKVRKVLVKHGLTHAQYNIMRVVEKNTDGVRISRIKKKMLFYKTDLTRMLDRLEKKGWIRREEDPEDRRSTTVRLTTTGKSLIKDIEPRLKDEFNDFFGNQISDEEARSLTKMLVKIRNT